MDSDGLRLCRIQHRTGYNSTGNTWEEETSHSGLQSCGGFVFALFLVLSLRFLPKNSKCSTQEPGHQTCLRFGPGDHCLLAVGAQSLPWNVTERRRHYYLCHWGKTHTEETLKCPQSHIRKQFARCAFLRMETILKRALFYVVFHFSCMHTEAALT